MRVLQWMRQAEPSRKVTEIGLPIVVGLGLGALIVFARGLPPKWAGLILLTVPAFTMVMVIKDLKKSLLAMILFAVPLNLDASVIISPHAYKIVAVTTLRVSLVTCVLIIAYALWLIEKPWKSGYNKVRFFSSVSLPSICLIFALVISLFRSTDTQLSLFQIAQYIELFLAYFYVANHIKNTEDLHFALRIILLGVLAESVLMQLQWATGVQFNVAGVDAAVLTSGFKDEQARVAGTIGGPNGAGAYLAAHLPIALAVIVASPKVMEKRLAALVFVMGAIAIVGTFSRSAWLGLLISILFSLLLGLWRGWVKVNHVVLIVVVSTILIAALYGPISYRLTHDDRGSAESRPILASLAWEIIKAEPMWGVGANNYALVVRRYVTPKQGGMHSSLLREPVHNKYLLIWAETGLIGFLSYVWFLLACLWQAILCAKSGSKLLSLVAIGLAGACLATDVRMFSQHGVGRTVNLYFWLLAALVVSIGAIGSCASDDSPLVAV